MKGKIVRNFGGSSCPQDDAKAIAQGAKSGGKAAFSTR